MQITRRRLMTGAVALGAMGALPRLGFSATTITLGETTIDTLSDGHLVLPTEFVSPNPGAIEMLAKFGITTPQVEAPCNVTLLRDGTNTVLFDVGAGPDFMPTAGKLSAALDALGVTPEDITHVVFTHAHPDHLWGVLDEFDEPIFANAQHMMGRAERDFWLSPEAATQMPHGREVFAAGALRRLSVLEDRLATFEDSEEILPGIGARASTGHTPGHMAFEIRSGNTAVMLTGDAIGNGHLAFAVPDWISGSDQDGETGISTRLGLLAELSASGLPMIGYHLPEGGIGRVERAGDAYRFVAEI
ncbi:MAG: MBL fold metallo-hydrolase [Paenirhodobacter sp.]|uniref:MBL fold metallo-hydrolase n=1 Tax=Paenirhodobacter sp. TaxID=1965326 RepID=UPI003D0DE9DD